ncbi:MAG TPA: hypothetical protein P5133_12225 [Spirochaetia bacterium]|nr:hypothetical protein [Spirochaetia bacterium]
MTSALAGVLDVATFKFCYIDSPANANTLFASVRTAIEGLESAYPGVTFVWWTMPIETSPNAQRQAYNDLVRSYCSANRKWLLDIADLESHNDSGAASTSGSYEILYSGYSSDGGHLNAAGAGKLAKAYWKLLAEIAKSR